MNGDKTTRRPWRISRRAFLKCGAGVAAGTAILPLSCTPGRRDSLWSSWSPIRFGIVTDCHYADTDPVGTRFYRQSLDKLSACVARMDAEELSFLIELGDFKDEDRPPVESRTLSYLQKVEAVFQRFRGPRYHVLGNHDLDSISKQQFLTRVENTGIDPGRSYYSFDVFGTFHFVVLDANYHSDGSDYDHGNFDWTDANIPAHELDWLRRDLAACSGSAVVFIHQRLDGSGSVFVKNAAEVRRILQPSGKVRAVFQGHHHEGGYSNIDGIHYYTLKAMVEGSGPHNNSYAVVEVHQDRSVTVSGYHKAQSIRLTRIMNNSCAPCVILNEAQRGAACGRNQKCLPKKQDVAPLQCSEGSGLRTGETSHPGARSFGFASG